MGLEDKLRKAHRRYRSIKRVLYPIFEWSYHARAEGNRGLKGPAVLFYLHPHSIDYAPAAYAINSPIAFVYKETAARRGFKIDLTTSLAAMVGSIPVSKTNNAHANVYRALCRVLDNNGIVGIALQDDSGISNKLEVMKGGVEMCLWYQLRRRKQIDLVPVGLDYSSIAGKVMAFPGTNIPLPLLTGITARIGEPVRTELPVRNRESVRDYAELYAFTMASEAARLSNMKHYSISVT